MKMSTRMKLGAATAALTTTTLFAAAVIPTASAADRDGRTTSVTTNAGVPTTIDPDRDLAAHTPGSETFWNESIYFTSTVKGGGHEFGVLVQTVNAPNAGQRSMTLTVTDKTTGWFKDYQTTYDKNDYNWSTSELDIKAPGLTWTGNAKKMSVQTTTPWGSLDFQLKAKGKALLYGGTGAFSLLGDTNYEYALPSMDTTGTLSVKDKTYKVSGETWLDRQWGPIAFDDSSLRWTWTYFLLPNGDKLAVWDAVNSKTENAWATVQHPDGSYELADVEPLADNTWRNWTSSASGNTYPTRVSVDIPSLKTHLAVHITGTDNQETVGALGSRMEATSSYAGVYQGKRVSGDNYIEMVGDWKD
ncbi:lipocalin-like domain-containing protein [Streptomyces justiciae]|uniref:lipocalin-like domain-containing protein n=1 Tax=Streptomyces justiciae TaxID=2780140 RepID=UPI0021193234|nr:lipocalin-like domain-containing protein [Streptomyces justiciae]MCW8378659.1 hypothetical protein [Streptomyces justiciae]